MATTFKQPKSKPQRRAPKERLVHVMTAFDGVNNSDDPASIGDNLSPDSLNTILDSIGAIESRSGYTKLLTTKLSVPSNNGWPFYKSDGTKQLIYRAGTFLYKYNNAGGSTQLNPVAWGSSTSDDADVYNDVLYGVDGAQMWSYNGATTSIVALAGVFTAPSRMRVHKNRTWVAQGSTLYFSDSQSPTSFPAGNFINVNSNDGQTIQALARTNDALIVFKDDSVWYVTGEPLGSGSSTTIGNLNLRRANSDVGCVAYRTVQTIADGVLVFMARSGLYVLQNYRATLISRDVNGTFKTGMNVNAQNLSWGMYSSVQKKYLLGYASSGSNTPDKVICFDTLVNHFTLWDDMPMGWAANFRFNLLDSQVAGDNRMGNIFNLFAGNADIAGYNSTATGGSSTTLVDTTAAWTTNQFVDCFVKITSGPNSGSVGQVTANTATTLTVTSWSAGNPAAQSVYTIGGFKSYWKTPVMDFDDPGMRKRYKYWQIFADSESGYNLQVGAAIDFGPLDFNQTALPLSVNSRFWDDGLGAWWDQPGFRFDTQTSLYLRTGLPGQGRFIQLMFGNFNANQPWRVFEHEVQYTLKKASPSNAG